MLHLIQYRFVPLYSRKVFNLVKYPIFSYFLKELTNCTNFLKYSSYFHDALGIQYNSNGYYYEFHSERTSMFVFVKFTGPTERKLVT